MYRVCSQLLVKSLRSSTRRRMSSQATKSEETSVRRLQMQLDHDMAMKRLELNQKRGLEHLGVSRDTANLLTVGGTTILVVSSGAWFVSQLLAETRANVSFLRRECPLQNEHLQRELANQSENMRIFISGGHNPKETVSEKPASEKQS